MQCPNCHGNIPDNSKFCTLCGAKIQSQPASGNPPYTNPNPGYSNPANPNYSHGSPAHNPGSSFTAGDLAGKAGQVGRKLASNVDFHNLNPVGLSTLMAVCWTILFVGCFVNLLEMDGEGLSFKMFSDLMKENAGLNMHFNLITGPILVLAIFGYFISLTRQNQSSRKLFTLFGILSLIAATILGTFFLYLIVILSAANSFTSEIPNITLMGYLSALSALAILVMGVYELRLTAG